MRDIHDRQQYSGAKPQFPVRGCWIAPRVRFSRKENHMKCHGSLGLYRKLREARSIELSPQHEQSFRSSSSPKK
jgi:hypothetical protein